MGREERKSKTDMTAPMQGGQSASSCLSFPFDAITRNKDSSRSLARDPPALPVSSGWASLWIPRAPKTLCRKSTGHLTEAGIWVVVQDLP